MSTGAKETKTPVYHFALDRTNEVIVKDYATHVETPLTTAHVDKNNVMCVGKYYSVVYKPGCDRKECARCELKK